jgi:SAM-dependent methyltransferase
MDHWGAHARQWSHVDSPLRPHADDIAALRELLRDQLPPASATPIEQTKRGLLLGVTPELARLGADIVAVDRERGMLDMLRGSAAVGHTSQIAVQGNWLDLPFATRSFDFAIGDGSFTLLRYPQDYHALFEQLRRVLKPAANLVMRIFTAPADGETCAAVVAAAYAGRINSFHAFKWRFAMALVARNRNPNIGVADIYREFVAWIPDRQALADSTGWPARVIDTIDVYRNSPAVYSFPNAEEWSVIAARHSDEIARKIGHYELAERCPIVANRLHV